MVPEVSHILQHRVSEGAASHGSGEPNPCACPPATPSHLPLPPQVSEKVLHPQQARLNKQTGFPGSPGARLPESRPVRTQTGNSQVQEEGVPERDEHCQEKQTDKQNNRKPQDDADLAPGIAGNDGCPSGSQGRPPWEGAGGTEVPVTESHHGSIGRRAGGARAFQKETPAKALQWE